MVALAERWYNENKPVLTAACGVQINGCQNWSNVSKEELIEVQEKRVGFFQAFKLFFTHYVDFEGKSTRAAYWWWQLWEVLFGCLLVILTAVLFIAPLARNNGELIGWEMGGILIPLLLAAIFGLGTLVPRIALIVRRYRDAGVNPLLVLVTLGLPYVVGQYLNFQMVIGMATLKTDDLVFAPIANHSILFGVGYGLILILGIVNFVVTLLPSTNRRRFM